MFIGDFFREGQSTHIHGSNFWEPPDVGLAPTGVWRVTPTPHSNWRTLPSSQPPSLPALSFPLPPTPLGFFCKAPGGGGPSWWGGGVLGRKGVEGGGGSKRHLGLDPHLGALETLSHRSNCSRGMSSSFETSKANISTSSSPENAIREPQKLDSCNSALVIGS